jgi:hypothetical protein
LRRTLAGVTVRSLSWRSAARAGALVALLAFALAGCGDSSTPGESTPDGGQARTDPDAGSGVDAGSEVHAATPTIIRFEVKQVCPPPGVTVGPGITVAEFLDVADDQGTHPWLYFLGLCDPKDGPGLLEFTSRPFEPGNYSFPGDLIPGLNVSTTDTATCFAFSRPIVARTFEVMPDGGQVLSDERTTYIEPLATACP